MATIISHAIVAGSLASITPGHVSKSRLTFVLALLAVLPDLDVIGFRLGIPYGHMLGHRGFTHSLLFAVLVAGITPAIFFRDVNAFTRQWWQLVILAFLATMSHGLLDAFTDAGLGVGFLIPFDDTRYFAPWRPLATSPLSVVAFVDGPALRILANELVWIGVPLMIVMIVIHLFRWRWRRRGD
jgi:inner membrane protein